MMGERVYSLLEARDFFWRHPDSEVLCVELLAPVKIRTEHFSKERVSERLCTSYQQAGDFYQPPFEVES